MRTLALVVLASLAACGSSSDGPPPKTYGGDRPADLHTPATLTDGKQYPLVVILHGYSASGFVQYAYFGAASLINSDRALVIAPDGMTNAQGLQFWNADPNCCDFEHTNVDDVAYIGGLIDDIMGELDLKRRSGFLPLLRRAHQARSQVFMTCTEENWPTELSKELQRWEVKAGKLTRP